MAERNQLQERFEEVKALVREHEVRIQDIQSIAFQLANYYFVFQGVILAAIASTTSLTCSDSGFIIALSASAAALNLLAFSSIARKYVRAMNWYDNIWSEYNWINQRIQNRTESSDSVPPGEWTDKYSQLKRYFVLVACVVFFLAFTGTVLWCARSVICNHDHQRKHPYGDMDCLKLCNGSRCIMFCQNP